jgi:hypothetical protein
MVAEQSLPAVTNGAVAAGSLGCVRERRRGKEIREEEERAVQRFKPLSRVKHIGVTQPTSTQSHTTYGSSIAPTELHQYA